MGEINGTAIAVLLAGGLLAYSGVKGAGIANTARSLIAGKTPATTPGGSEVGTGEGVAPVPTPSANGAVAAKNQAIGRMLAAPYGWSAGSEWDALVALWNRESGWNNTADTRVTGAGGDGPGSSVFAYGVAQARPATKYPLAGRPPDLGGISSATAQIAWGLRYIKSVYGSPSNAWAHEESNGWY